MHRRIEKGDGIMMKKTGITFFSLLLTVLMVTGCGKAAQTADSQEAGLQTAALAETEDGSDDTEDKISLTVWCAEEDGALLNDMISRFQEAHKDEAELAVTLAYQSESQCKDELFKDIEGGPDVFAFVDDQLRTMVAVGALAPAADAESIKNANIEGANEAASVNDILYAYPMTADNGYFLYYNKAYFGDEDIRQLDTILQIAAENDKKVTMDWSSGWYLYSFFGATGLEMGLNDDGVSNYCNWNAVDTPVKGVDVAEAMLSIASHPGFLNCTDSDFMAGVQDGTVIAGISGVWNANAVEAAWGNDYGAAKLPTYTCAGSQIQMASFTGYKMLGVNAYSENEEWAQKLAAWITNEENQTLRFAQRGQGPSKMLLHLLKFPNLRRFLPFWSSLNMAACKG